MSVQRPCPVCKGLDTTPVIGRRNYQYIRCGGCQTVYLDPMPSAEEAAALYQNSAYFMGDEGTGYRDYYAMHKALAPHFRRRLRVLAKHLPRRGRLLDVGCADGYFLEMARADGWEVMGVEVSEEMAAKASGRLNIPIVTSVDRLLPVEFDAITMWEVLEHLPDPVAELQCLAQRLRPGGFLMLSTPNAGHWQALRAPETWTAYCPPAHLVLFTADSLQLALEKAGLFPIRIWKVSPLPPLPAWLQQATRPLALALADGSAHPWALALMLWRGVRLLGWAWQKVAHPQDDIFATLEALACRPA